jgi:glutaredoxin 3
MNIEGVPAFLIDGETVIGFDRRRIEELLDHSITACTKCGAKLRLPAGKGTIRVTCPKCGERFKTST